MDDDCRELARSLRDARRELREARKRVRSLEYRLSREGTCKTPGCGNPAAFRNPELCMPCLMRYASAQPGSAQGRSSRWAAQLAWSVARWDAWRDPDLYILGVLKGIVADLESAP